MTSPSQAEAVISRLLEERGSGKTVCPSEAARDLSHDEDDWREQMETVHRAVDRMLARGDIAISWKGRRLPERRGPYRIAHP